MEPINEGLQELNRNLEVKEEKPPQIGSKRRLLIAADYGISIWMIQWIKRLVYASRMNAKFLIGNKIIKIQGDNIVIGNEVLVGTPGLLTLITEKNPKEYDEKAYERYTGLFYETNVLYRDYDPRSSHPRANRSTKWIKIIHPIWEDFQHEGIVHSNSEVEAGDDEYFIADGLCRIICIKMVVVSIDLFGNKSINFVTAHMYTILSN